MGALVQTVLKPAALFMHNMGIFEAAGYFGALALSVQGSRYSASQADAGIMVALSGAALFMPLWFYSTKLHTFGSGDHRAFMRLTCLLVDGVLVPLAILHGSRLMGAFAVFAVYSG